MCIYTASEDAFVSKSLLETGLYRPDLASILETYSKESPHDGSRLIFIDAGSHVGYFSILAAKFGYDVYGVEPLTINNLRAFRAAELNKVKIHLYR